MPTETEHQQREQTSDVDALMTVDALTALMRSTWTWDDRALRRDLSTLLVQLDAAALTSAGADDAIGSALHAAALVQGSRFVAAVLGPKLIADTGNPLRQHFLEFAGDPAQFGRRAQASRRAVTGLTESYFKTHIDGADFVAPSSWPALVAGGGVAGLATAMRGFGHELSAATLFASIGLAWQATSLITGSDAAAKYAEQLRSGSIVATLAAAEQTGSWDPALVKTRAQRADENWLLTGDKLYVPAADAADVLFVIARSIAGPSLFAVDAAAQGLSIAAHPVLDDTRPLFGVTLSNTPATLISREGGGGKLMSQLIDAATTALAAEQVGLIERAIGVLRDTTAAPDDDVVGLMLDHCAARALWQRAVNEPSPAAAAAAHIGCSAAATRATTTVAELTGSDDITTSLVLRALSGSLLFGGPALAHERLLDRLGI